MKTCSRCEENKPIEAFYRHPAGADGYMSRCKTCICHIRALHRKANPDKVKQTNSKWKAKSRERLNKISARYRNKDPELTLLRVQQWRQANPGKVAANAAKRRAAKHQRTPRWLTAEHIQQMKDVYIAAQTTGMVVDHIIPLLGKEVCGLHVPWNLQLMTAADNLKKGNRLT